MGLFKYVPNTWGTSTKGTPKIHVAILGNTSFSRMPDIDKPTVYLLGQDVDDASSRSPPSALPSMTQSGGTAPAVAPKMGNPNLMGLMGNK